MVVNKKQSIPVAPPMGSRTNSTQPLTRQKAPINSKSSSAGPPTSSTISSTSSQKHKHKKQLKSTKSTSSSSFKDKLIFFFLSIFTLYALTTCPSDITLSNPVCRSLSQYRTHVLEPYVLPPIQKALSHPSLAPAVSKFHAAERVVTPVVIRTHAIARPYIAKVTQFSTKTVQATFSRTVLPIYRRYVSPRVQLFKMRIIEPYFAPLGRKAEFYVNKTIITLHRVFVTVKPHIQTVYIRARPYAERAWDAARPYLFRAAEAGTTSLGIAMEKSAEARRLYVDPHVMRIWEKVVELSGTSSTSSASTTVAAKATTTRAEEETKGTSVEVEPETADSSTLSSSIASVTVSATPSTSSVFSESSSETVSPSVPEEPVVPVETPTQTPQVDEATFSAASVIHESISDTAVSLLLEVSSSVSSAAQSISPSDATSSVVLTTASPSTVEESSSAPDVDSTASASSVEEATPEPEVEPQPESETESATASEEQADDLDSFFADIGFEDQVEEEDPELGSDDHASMEPDAPALSSEEAKEARRIATAEKRAKIEARMEKWTTDMQSLVKRRAKQVRKELVRVRKGAVRGLFPDPSKGDNSDLEETLTHVRGEDVAGMLGRLEAEGDKLLKGLESYLKKEEKILAGKDLDDRLKRWDNVVRRVEDKFVERMTEMQEKVHWWYLEVRELEVQEYHAAVAEVKTMAEKAQADVGMELAWLDDVTYNDWQKYHDYMRSALSHGLVYERFDEQVRLIQNGSHPSPPIDPLVPALDKLQTELEDLVGGFQGQVRSLGGRMRELLTPPAEKNVDVEGEKGVVETPGDEEKAVSEQEDEVRILPIDPGSAPAAEEFDLGSVVIGKSKEQVEQAMKAAQDIHEEL